MPEPDPPPAVIVGVPASANPAPQCAFRVVQLDEEGRLVRPDPEPRIAEAEDGA